MKLLWFEPTEHDLVFREACWVSVAKSIQCVHSYFLTQISSSMMASQIRMVSIEVPL